VIIDVLGLMFVLLYGNLKSRALDCWWVLRREGVIG
jgi:hypothetical protein